MVIDCEAQRPQLGDVVLIDLPDQPAKVAGKVVRPIERTESAVLVTLRVAGQDDFVREWMLDERWSQLPRGPSRCRGASRRQTNQAQTCCRWACRGELCSEAPKVSEAEVHAESPQER
jgi:hypothetical protein